MDDNAMKYWAFILCLFFSSANAALLQMDYSTATVYTVETGAGSEGAASMTLDMETDQILSLSFDAPGIGIAFSGAHNLGWNHNGDQRLPIWTTGPISLTGLMNGEAAYAELSPGSWEIHGPASATPYNLIRNGLFFSWSIWVGSTECALALHGSPDSVTITTINTSAEVPEPASLALLGLGLAGLVRRRS